MSKDYMENIYSILNAPEVDMFDDGVEYLDEPVDDFENMYEEDYLAWGDNITYLDEPEEEQFDLDLGEGFIPLPQGEIYQEEILAIDENYVLDELEEDLIGNYVRPSIEERQVVEYSFDDIYGLLDEEDTLALENAESIMKLPVQQEAVEELKVLDMNDEDTKIANAIAKEHLDMVKAGEAAGALYGDVESPEDDTSWVDGPDLFGNNIEVIIAEDPNKEVEENDFVDGSFEDWMNQQNQE